MAKSKSVRLSDEQLKALQDMLAQYGWKIDGEGWVDSPQVLTIGRLLLSSSGNYFYHPRTVNGDLGDKLWGGYGNLVPGFEKFLQEFYYVQKKQ